MVDVLDAAVVVQVALVAVVQDAPRAVLDVLVLVLLVVVQGAEVIALRIALQGVKTVARTIVAQHALPPVRILVLDRCLDKII